MASFYQFFTEVISSGCRCSIRRPGIMIEHPDVHISPLNLNLNLNLSLNLNPHTSPAISCSQLPSCTFPEPLFCRFHPYSWLYPGALSDVHCLISFPFGKSEYLKENIRTIGGCLCHVPSYPPGNTEKPGEVDLVDNAQSWVVDNV